MWNEIIFVTIHSGYLSKPMKFVFSNLSVEEKILNKMKYWKEIYNYCKPTL